MRRRRLAILLGAMLAAALGATWGASNAGFAGSVALRRGLGWYVSVCEAGERSRCTGLELDSPDDALAAAVEEALEPLFRQPPAGAGEPVTTGDYDASWHGDPASAGAGEFSVRWSGGGWVVRDEWDSGRSFKAGPSQVEARRSAARRLVGLVRRLDAKVRRHLAGEAPAIRGMALEPGEEAPEWHPVLARRLASDVSCGFEGTPLEEALDYLQSVSKFNVVIDPDLAKVPAVPRTVSADLQCVELRRALAWVLDEAGLECCALDGALYVSTREGVQKMLKREGDFRVFRQHDLLEAFERRITLDLKNAPLSEVLDEFSSRLGLRLSLDPAAARAAKPVTIGLRDVKMRRAFSACIDAAGVGWAAGGGSILVTTTDRTKRFRDISPGAQLEWKWCYLDAMDRRVTFCFVDTPLEEGISFLQTLTHTNMILDPGAFEGSGGADVPITLQFHDLELDLALRWILRLAGLGYTFANSAIFITTPERAKEVYSESVMEEGDLPGWKIPLRDNMLGPVSFEFQDAPAGTVLEFLHGRSEVRSDLLLDPGAAEEMGRPTVTAGLDEAEVFLAWEWVMLLAGLDYTLVEGKLFVSTRERVAEVEARNLEHMKRRISYEFSNRPFSEAIEALRTECRYEILVDPTLGSLRALGSPVNLKVTDMSFELGLSWVCKLVELDWWIVDGRIFVSTRERVERAREKGLRELLGPAYPGPPKARVVPAYELLRRDAPRGEGVPVGGQAPDERRREDDG